MDGILLVDKPAGWTSHDVVAKVRSTLRAGTHQKLKVGHTGTLDPMATGLLILVLGSYTKQAIEFSKLDKVYEAELTLGAVSSTGDSEGEISLKSKTIPSLQQIENCLANFRGQIQQIPPIYSAIKVGGQRSYKLARKGQKVELEPRNVIIYEISLLNYIYPKLKLLTRVSSGTYIRSLAEDIGEALSTGAYLSALRRTQVGNYSVDGAVKLDHFGELSIIKKSIVSL